MSPKASPIQASEFDILASREFDILASREFDIPASRAVRNTVCLAVWLVCGGSWACERYPESEYPSAPPPGVAVAEEDVTPAPPGTVWRRDVNAVLDAGLGRFLQRVELQPEVEQGGFVGFRIVELRPPSWWQGVDLAPGDVVTQVNGMPIEQPTEAHAAFEALRTADKLTVRYLRAGQPRELIYSILDKPLPAPTGPAPKTSP